MRFLLEGRPGVGKTTVARRVVTLLHARDLAVTGFTTKEIRRGARRQGFAVETIDGQRGILAHVELPGPPRVGRYGVDLAAFERVALPVLEEAPLSGVVVIDELGKMELASAPFRTAVSRLFEQEVPLVATVHVFKDDLTDALKRRRDVEVVKVSASNRESLPQEIVARLLPS
jgi:nucleoside-triphosphatase